MKTNELQWNAITTQDAIIHAFGADFNPVQLRNMWLHMTERHWKPSTVLMNTLALSVQAASGHHGSLSNTVTSDSAEPLALLAVAVNESLSTSTDSSSLLDLQSDHSIVAPTQAALPPRLAVAQSSGTWPSSLSFLPSTVGIQLADKYPTNAPFSMKDIIAVELRENANREYSSDEVELLRYIYDNNPPRLGNGSSVDWDVLCGRFIYKAKLCTLQFNSRYGFYARDQKKFMSWAKYKFGVWNTRKSK
jgi:hypothetical protein